jgi:Uma2 family endonuclease
MLLGGDVRAADAAMWRRDQLGEYSGGYRRVAPVLAVEIAGRDDGEQKLRDKANWYLDHGVQTVWLVLPDDRRVVVLSIRGETQHRGANALPRDPALVGLRPRAAEFFRQLDVQG